MENYQITLTEQATEDLDVTLDLLMSAVQDISTASENDFGLIKSKKWYNRLWELITFNNDTQRIQARGVGNLSKLHEITMKAIVLVSKQSKEIAEKVNEGIKEISFVREDVMKLSEQHRIIISDIQKIKRGFDTEERFDELSTNQRDIIFAVLRKYALEASNEDTGRLIAMIRQNAHDTSEDVDYEIIESRLTSPNAQKMLFRILQAYSILLNNCPADEEHELFQYICLSENAKKKIRIRVQEDLDLYGKNEYISLFGSPIRDYEVSTNDDGIEWELFDLISEECNEQPDELEVIYITNMVHIAEGETKTYAYKEIHLGSLIHNCGILKFDHCIIHYNEKDISDEISLEKNAEIHATNCTFICANMDKNPQITLNSDCTATFDECTFIDCSYFLSSSYEKNLCIANSKLYNCYCFAFVKTIYSNSGEFSLRNTIIQIDENYKYEGKDPLFYICAFTSRISNVFVSSSVTIKLDLFHLPDEKNSTVSDSTFKGIHGEIIITANQVKNCLFEDCISDKCLISASDVRTCIFDNCSRIIHCRLNAFTSNALVTQCKFVNCKNELIDGGSNHNFEVSYCEFIDYINTCKDSPYYSPLDFCYPISAIYSRVTGEHSYLIKKCVFDGVNIDEGLLIAAKALDKSAERSLRIVECDFRDCITKRKSGAIIRRYSFYRTKFKKEDKRIQVVVTENCRGLDKVMKEGPSTCQNPIMLTNIMNAKADTGCTALSIENIGSSLSKTTSVFH